jgi:hypothetical protein
LASLRYPTSNSLIRALFVTLIFVLSIVLADQIGFALYSLPIYALALLAAFKNTNHNFDHIDLFWLLSLLFFVLAPANDLLANSDNNFYSQGVSVSYSRGEGFYTYNEFLAGQSIVYIALFFAYLFLPNKIELSSTDNKKNIDLSFNGIYLILLLIILFVVTVHFKGGIENLLASRYFQDKDAGSLVTIFFETAFLLATLISIRIFQKDRKYIFIIVALFLLLLMYNPINTARFKFLQAWLPVLFVLTPFLFRYKVFSIGFVLSAVFLLPIMSLTSREGLDALENFSFNYFSFLGFFDVHQTLLELVRMVSEDGYAYGQSILSVILFMVPRVLWDTKPDIIALIIGERLFYLDFVGTANLSGPIFFDFYYDFGWVGVVFGSILVTLFFKYLLKLNLTINGINYINILLLSALPILYRGSVGAVISIIFFTLVYYFVIYFIFKNRKARKYD